MEDTIRELQDRVNAALLGSDRRTLSELIAPDARIIGPKGFLIDRDTWIGVHQESEYQQVRLDVVESDMRDSSGAGIRFDVVESECLYNGQTIQGRFRVTQVWFVEQGRWQLVSVQYTSIA
jgi:uncharacterized protein DUF4440